MISHSPNKSKTRPQTMYLSGMKCDVAASTEDTLFRAPEKVHTSAAKCVVTFAFKNGMPY